MLIGCKISNFDVFDDDKCGLLMEDYVKAGAGNRPSGTPLLNLNALIATTGSSDGRVSFF